MPSYNQNDSQVIYDFSNKQTKGAFLTKVFGMMFICLLITTVVAAGFGYGFQYLLNTTAVDGVYNEKLLMGLFVTLGISIVALLVMSFVLPITFARGRHNIFVPLMIYVVLMGLMLSTFTFIFDWVILVESFGITSVIFGVMALLGYISKGRLAGIGFILIGLLIGAAALSLINWGMMMFGYFNETNVRLYWIVSLLIFAFLMLVTLYDVYRIKKIAEAGAGNDNNLTYYCAYILYSDFIAILIRVIYYVAMISGRRR